MGSGQGNCQKRTGAWLLFAETEEIASVFKKRESKPSVALGIGGL